MQGSKIPVLFGATASGKTELSLALANALGGQIINMDALQIYKKLSIGTAKPTEKERREIPHHLFDFLDPVEEYSVAQYQQDALATMEQVKKEGSIPIFVGGTGLYLSSLYYDFTFREKRGEEEAFMALLREIGEEGIVSILREAGVEGLDCVDTKNPHRLLRVWQTRTVHRAHERVRSNIPLVLFHLHQPRSLLHERIAKRTKRMLEEGLVEEVRALLAEGVDGRYPAMKGIGYKETISFLEGFLTLQELEEKIIIHTRRYARRQITWIRNQYPDVIELNATEPLEALVESIRQWIKESS